MANKGEWRKALEVASVGLEMAIAIAIGFLVGRYLDRRFGTEPYLLVLFGVAGIGAAFKALWRTARRYWPKD